MIAYLRCLVRLETDAGAVHWESRWETAVDCGIGGYGPPQIQLGPRCRHEGDQRNKEKLAQECSIHQPSACTGEDHLKEVAGVQTHCRRTGPRRELLLLTYLLAGDLYMIESVDTHILLCRTTK
jgi:hypothetical protein